ncbi:RNA polymerase sigma factor [Bacillus alkalicellulosilyticus]|uniref:RNA polymerase sigma factor n=1 Tax=Alkalihalobacterium alkalicellulosilyticum TaxID=1912214 RepID=UPI001482DB3F|nr:sigma-70 family RNA polymerase sigma factor [Bacillus alkalicellulosilyticus]
MTASIDQLYNKHAHDVYYYILSLCRNHHLAEEITQETFYRAYVFIDQYDGERIKAWLFKVAYHTFVDVTRKNKRILTEGEPFFQQQPDESRTPEQTYEITEALAEAGQFISRLPQKQQQAILLHDIHELSYQEAAEILEVTIGYFKILLYRARQTLRQERSKYDE